MPETKREVLRRYLDDAVAAEKGFETQLRSFAEEGDDSEVQQAFAEQARRTSSHVVQLTARLEDLGGSHSRAKGFMAQLFSLAPRTAQITHGEEERLAQNLIMAYAAEMSQCAMYEALGVSARLAGDHQTADLAAAISSEEREAAIQFWQFLPSRSKIAFNMLTAGEVDPSVETRAPDDRLVQ